MAFRQAELTEGEIDFLVQPVSTLGHESINYTEVDMAWSSQLGLEYTHPPHHHTARHRVWRGRVPPKRVNEVRDIRGIMWTGHVCFHKLRRQRQPGNNPPPLTHLLPSTAADSHDLGKHTPRARHRIRPPLYPHAGVGRCTVDATTALRVGAGVGDAIYITVLLDNCTGQLHGVSWPPCTGTGAPTGLDQSVGGVVEGDVKFKVFFLVCFVCACVN